MSISVNNISKSYKNIKAVENITFNVNEGELFGLIGPDGAGKTTIFRILTTLLVANEGSAEVAGYDVINGIKEIRNSVGYMPGKFSLYQDLTVEENLEFFATMFGTPKSRGSSRTTARPPGTRWPPALTVWKSTAPTVT